MSDESSMLDPARVSTARSMTLYALGALVGLSIAGYGLFTGGGTSTRSVPPENVAVVNQRPVLRSDFITQVESETGGTFQEATREDKLRVLDEMVREELLVQRSLELDFAETDQDARNALVAVVTQQILADSTTGTPSEDALRAWFAQHGDQYTDEGSMKVRHLVLPAPNGPSQEALRAAQAAAAALQAGTDAARVMRQFGLTEPRQDDEDFYFAARFHLGEPLFAAVQSLRAGDVSMPITLPDGVHVVLMEHNQPPRPLGYEDARSLVLTDYTNNERSRLLEGTLEFLRERSTILIADDYAADYGPLPAALPGQVLP